MKHFILASVAFFPLLVFSQKDFEGIITYKGFEDNPLNTFEAKFFLSKGKVKLKTIYSNPAEANGKKFVICNFISGLEYSVDEEYKSFSVDSIDQLSFDEMRFIFKDTSLAQNILGYPCRAYTIKPEEKSIMSGLQVTSWYSDSLRFTVPPKYRGISSFASLPDGNILFLKIVIFEPRDIDDDKIEIDSTFVNAVKIERMSLKESEFLPPAGYTKIELGENEESTYSDSLLVDSSVIKVLTIEELKNEQPKKPPPAKSSNPSKSPAKKEKETKPVKG